LLFTLRNWQFRVEDIDNAVPNDIRPYLKAMDLEYDYLDTFAWIIGQYSYVAHGKVLSSAFSGKRHGKNNDYPDKPFHRHIETREMTKEEFDALPKDEKEKVFMQMIDNMMAPAIAGFKRKKALEDEDREDG